MPPAPIRSPVIPRRGLEAPICDHNSELPPPWKNAKTCLREPKTLSGQGFGSPPSGSTRAHREHSVDHCNVKDRSSRTRREPAAAIEHVLQPDPDSNPRAQ